jgi:hypothetical protein
MNRRKTNNTDTTLDKINTTVWEIKFLQLGEYVLPYMLAAHPL